jgi:hypothetical protein
MSPFPLSRGLAIIFCFRWLLLIGIRLQLPLLPLSPSAAVFIVVVLQRQQL